MAKDAKMLCTTTICWSKYTTGRETHRKIKACKECFYKVSELSLLLKIRNKVGCVYMIRQFKVWKKDFGIFRIKQGCAKANKKNREFIVANSDFKFFACKWNVNEIICDIIMIGTLTKYELCHRRPLKAPPLIFWA